MPKRGRSRKKSRTHVAEESNTATTAAVDKVPKSLVIRRGKTAPPVGELVADIRQMFLPYTALNFQDDPKNRKLTLQQYATNLALPMGITHILALSQTNENLNLRLGRTPQGPTLYFKVVRFSLAKHVQALQKRPVAWTNALTCHPPVVVTNNFGNEHPHVKLQRITFQNLFPATNVAQVQLAKEVRRVVLFDQMENGNVQVRQYAIRTNITGVNRKIRRVVQAKLPNLQGLDDIADYVQGNGGFASDAPSDSEPEENVVVPVDGQSRKNTALKLVELGPRLELELYKVEQGLGTGNVLYHKYVQKTPTEAAALKDKHEQAQQLQAQRRQIQETNVERKRLVADEKRQAKKQRRQEQQAQAMEALRTATATTTTSDDDEQQEGSSGSSDNEDPSS